MMPRAQGLCSLLMAVVVVACSVPANRHVSDRAPPDIDPSAVPDAIPQADTITRAGNSSPYTVNGQSYWVLASARGYRERGIASWYGLKFHGRPTANGERFSVYGPTAAHRSLPIPTYVRVTNEDNGASMVLRVNDRGPFHSDRLIDLSYGAAVRLGFADQGTASVLVEAIDVPGMQDVRSDAANGYSRLQLGAFSTPFRGRGAGPACPGCDLGFGNGGSCRGCPDAPVPGSCWALCRRPGAGRCPQAAARCGAARGSTDTLKAHRSPVLRRLPGGWYHSASFSWSLHCPSK